MDLNKHVINTLEKRENDVICEVICNADPKSSHDIPYARHHKPRILSLKNEEFPFLVHKLSAIQGPSTHIDAFQTNIFS